MSQERRGKKLKVLFANSEYKQVVATNSGLFPDDVAIFLRSEIARSARIDDCLVR